MKPILFSVPLVQAILEGRKTQTRRVIKPQYAIHSNGTQTPLEDFIKNTNIAPFAPHQVGDILYVRETWRKFYHYAYKASPETYPKHANGASYSGIVWKPSIHMPKEAARIFLRVTDVRVERVQDISETDAKAEGVDAVRRKTDGTIAIFARNSFQALWDSIYAKRGYGWETNPYVWVYTFERISKEEATI